jgi:hypothetical protein
MAQDKYPDVPNDEVGAMVQSFVDAGATKVTVTPNADGKTCTVVIKK